MIRSISRVRELEAGFQRDANRDLTYEEALQTFAALWAEARELNPTFGSDWLEDLKPDFAVARAVNGLPPAS